MRKVDLLPDKVVTRYMFIEEKSRIFEIGRAHV